jgi:hypothetical protein
MIKRPRIVLALAAVMSTALVSFADSQPVVGGYTILNASFDELVERQSLGLQAMYFGGQGILDDGQTSVTPYAFLGFYGYESIMGGLGGSVQTEALLPLGIGAGFGVMDADLRTYAFGINAHKQVTPSTWSSLLLQGVGAYQWKSKARGDYTAIYLKPALWPDNPEGLVLFDDFDWFSAYFHAVFEARWHFVKPLLDFGWLANYYRYTGYECDRDCFGPGNVTSGNGNVSSFTFGVGVSLELEALKAFGGIKGNGSDAIFLVSLSISF